MAASGAEKPSSLTRRVWPVSHEFVSPSGATNQDAGDRGSQLDEIVDEEAALSELEDVFGKKFVAGATLASMVSDLLRAGPGARGIVYGNVPGRSYGHVFNVVNKDGVVRFLDGQVGTPPNLNAYTNYRLLRTN